VRPLPLANPPNPWSSTAVEYLDEAPNAELEVYEEKAKSIVAENDSPDVGFRFSVNPYRGCMHACAYCYARPSHQYWGFGAGTDFDRKIIAKVNAPELLRETMQKRSWTGELILFSGNTDCYQPLEASYRLTRQCLEVCLEFRNPCAVITKSALVRRDADVLGELAKRARASACISIPFANEAMARAIEPYASAPAARFETIRRLAESGVRVGVNVAPVIPGLNDSDIPEILERAKAAGATRAAIIPVRLSAEVLPVFTERLMRAYPDRFKKVVGAIREMRAGKMNESTFGERMRGHGPRWEMIERLFDQQTKALGLIPSEPSGTDVTSTFKRPEPKGQQSLFDDLD
jgi:DNA repair photolyase